MGGKLARQHDSTASTRSQWSASAEQYNLRRPMDVCYADGVSTDSVPDVHEALDRLVNDFFRTFARFEYALKVTRFYRRTGDDAAQPDWTAFARSVSDALNKPADASLGEAIEYILHCPPRKQVIRDDTLGWIEGMPTPRPGDRADLVLMLVRRVRNNLFHGGKFSHEWFDPTRSEQLLTHSLRILHGCLEASAVVHDAYHNGDGTPEPLR